MWSGGKGTVDRGTGQMSGRNNRKKGAWRHVLEDNMFKITVMYKGEACRSVV